MACRVIGKKPVQIGKSNTYELFARLDSSILIPPHARRLIRTGVIIETPQKPLVESIFESAFKNGIGIIGNGCIDGELHVVVVNHGTFDYPLNNGDRIAQITVYEKSLEFVDHYLEIEGKIFKKDECTYSDPEHKILHSFSDNPARVNENGAKEWYRYGCLYKRIDLQGTTYYFANGKLTHSVKANGNLGLMYC